MSSSEKKCVMALDASLPLGILANTAAILGVTLGLRFPELVGSDVVDASGGNHPGIVQLPIPILKGSEELLHSLHEKIAEEAFNSSEDASDLFVVDFSSIAQGCLTYDDYIEKMSQTPEAGQKYLGLALYGPKKKVNHLTGSLPLLR